MKPEERLVVARTRKLQIANDKLAALYHTRSEVLTHTVWASALCERIWEAKFVSEWPTAAATLDVPDMRGLGRRLYDAAAHEFQAELRREWGKE